nr:uncharacterized mitochondrial protein AtMg00810-like [Tanacetum cinerariifolium]
MYLTAFRPNIMFAVCACSRFQVTPKLSHLHAVKRIFRYLKGQPKLGLWYPRDSPFNLEAYSDSDYAGANLDRKSITGGCQFFDRRLISWQCEKQTIVPTSTTEAEDSYEKKLIQNQEPLLKDILGVTILRHIGRHYPNTYWEHYPKTYWASLPEDILGALPKDILGALLEDIPRALLEDILGALPKDILGALPKDILPEDILGVITRRHTFMYLGNNILG